MADESVCMCPDFDPVDGDPITAECECGHVEDEHESGFFRACTIGAEEDGGV
jgi:hypothetical protein